MLSGFILSPSFRILKRSYVREPHPFSHVRLFFRPADLCYIGAELTGIIGEVDLGARWGGMEPYLSSIFKYLNLNWLCPVYGLAQCLVTGVNFLDQLPNNNCLDMLERVTVARQCFGT